MSKATKKMPSISKADKRVLSSYVAQSYLYKKYSKLRTDTKELVGGIFDKSNVNVFILDDKSYVQKINRSQRRFDSTNFVKYVNASGETDLQDLISRFYKNIDTVEFKPFHNDYEQAIKKDLGGFDVK